MRTLVTAFLGGCLLLPPPATACSFFLCARGGVVLAGNNEDYVDPYTKMWFEPGEGGELGRVYFGFSNLFPQGGMNEAGLFFDGAALAGRFIEPHPSRDRFEGNLVDEAMRTCETVEQVLELWQRYDPSFLTHAQVQFGDATGDSVIVEGDRMHRKEGDYQITTNFRQAEVAPGAACPCPRYRTIESMLEGDGPPTVDLVRRALAAVHQEGEVSTLYSNIYDLKNRRVHLYHFHNFEEVVTIDLLEELDRGRHEVVLHELFPETFSVATFKQRYERKRTSESCRRLPRATRYATISWIPRPTSPLNS